MDWNLVALAADQGMRLLSHLGGVEAKEPA
jgi:hypothetical protein